jgi:hypothetical protein
MLDKSWPVDDWRALHLLDMIGDILQTAVQSAVFHTDRPPHKDIRENVTMQCNGIGKARASFDGDFIS